MFGRTIGRPLAQGRSPEFRQEIVLSVVRATGTGFGRLEYLPVVKPFEMWESASFVVRDGPTTTRGTSADAPAFSRTNSPSATVALDRSLDVATPRSMRQARGRSSDGDARRSAGNSDHVTVRADHIFIQDSTTLVCGHTYTAASQRRSSHSTCWRRRRMESMPIDALIACKILTHSSEGDSSSYLPENAMTPMNGLNHAK